MNPFWKEILWHQFGAAIETLQNALNACAWTSSSCRKANGLLWGLQRPPTSCWARNMWGS